MPARAFIDSDPAFTTLIAARCASLNAREGIY